MTPLAENLSGSKRAVFLFEDVKYDPASGTLAVRRDANPGVQNGDIYHRVTADEQGIVYSGPIAVESLSDEAGMRVTLV